MEACVIFCRSKKPPKKRGKVLLIDAVNEIARERAISLLRPEHQQRIEAAYDAFVDEEGFAKVAAIEEIAAQGYSLSIPLYVKRKTAASGMSTESAPSLSQAWVAWEESGSAFWSEMDAVVDLLDGLIAEEPELAEVANG
jgi:type I restriction enzyme M protein